MFDCHVHTKFSPDGFMSAEEACIKAMEAGLDGLSFTDHLDFDFPDFDDVLNPDFNEYIRYMKLIKDRMKNDLKISIGVEVGIQPHVIEPTLNVVSSYSFDYVLASVHVIDRIDPYKREYYRGKTRTAAYEKYLKEILFMVRNFPDFDNVGHFEYITRCADYDDRTLRYNDHIDLFDELLGEIIQRGKGFEINTGSFREKPDIRTCEYDIAVLKRYRELGGEIVSLGSDAHNTEYIGYKFDFFRDMLLEAGFSHAAWFNERKPVFYKL